MRRFPLPTLVLLPVLLLAGAAAAQSIKLDPTFMDLGKMKQMDTRSFTVKVTNVGAGLLIIDDVHADCGCTVPELKVKALKAGETTDMTIHFDSKSFTGEVHKIVHISSNDPDNPKLEFNLTADVRAVLAIDPVSERIGFPKAMFGETATREVTFTAPDLNLKIQASASQKGLFGIKVTNNVSGDPHKSVLEITRPAKLEPGQHEDMVRVTTNVPERATVDISLRAWVALEVSPTPDIVNFRYQPTFDQDVKIAASSPPLDFKVLRVECDLPEIKFQIVETVPKQETHIKLTGKPIDKSDPRAIAGQGRIAGTLKVYTNLKSIPVIEVPVSYMIRP